MKRFRREQSMYVAEADEAERRILGGVFADTALLLGVDLGDDEGPGADEATQLTEDLLSTWSEEDVGEPLDPALARLLPSAHEDDEVAAEFRRLTESDIRRTKVDRLRNWVEAFSSPGPKIYVPVAGAGEWVAALTDVRLVLANRLEIETDVDAEAVYARTEPEGDGDADYTTFALGQIYGALTWLQESLLQAMMSAR